MKEILEDVDRWRRGGDRVALATVVATRRSAPRPPGAKLAVSSSGELAGSVSGGCVENDVYGVAQNVLGGGEPRLLTYGISDDLTLEIGLPCGGEIDVFVEETDRRLVDRLRRVIEDECRAVLFTIVAGANLGERWLGSTARARMRRGSSRPRWTGFSAQDEARCWNPTTRRSSRRCTSLRAPRPHRGGRHG